MSEASSNSTRTTSRRYRKISLLGLSVAGSLFAGWVGYQLNWIRERHNAPIFHGISQDMIVTPDGGYRLVVMPQDAPWPLGWFGESGETVLGVEDGLPKAEIERIRRLFPEADADIEFIAREDIDPAYRR